MAFIAMVAPLLLARRAHAKDAAELAKEKEARKQALKDKAKQTQVHRWLPDLGNCSNKCQNSRAMRRNNILLNRIQLPLLGTCTQQAALLNDNKRASSLPNTTPETICECQRCIEAHYSIPEASFMKGSIAG